MNVTGPVGGLAPIAVMITAGACLIGCAVTPSPQPSAVARPAAPARSAGTVTSSLPAPDSPCRHPQLRLRRGQRVPAGYLAAVQFLSPARGVGVGVTESRVSCMIGSGGGGMEGLTPWPVVSADGGRTRRAAGAQLPLWLQPGSNLAQLALSAAGTGWLAAGGALAFTRDGGRHWRRVIVGGQVAELTSGGSVVAALVLRHDVVSRVWRLAPGSSRHWPLPPVPGPASPAGLAISPSMAILASSGSLVLDVPGGKRDRLIVIGRSGRRWASRTAPCGQLNGPQPGSPLAGFQALVTARGGQLGALCGHGVGMQQEVQSFLLSRDGGRTWQRRSAEVPGRADPSGLPLNLTAVASAGSAFFIAAERDVMTSIDGGLRWRSGLPRDFPGYNWYGAAFSFLGRRHGWLLLQGVGLLGTSDGSRWAVLGKLAA